MQDDLSDPEFNRMLARAFDGAWQSYFRSGRGTINPEFARWELAKRIVKLAREGERVEEALAAGGLEHLLLLTSMNQGQ
jgi:hypothetical protein